MATIERGELLSKQVEEALRERIRQGRFAPGEKLPPENELAAEYGVSRATVRAAMSNLQREGTVVRRQGAGTFVTHAAAYLDSRLEGMWDCEDMIRALGHEPSVGWLEYEETLPDKRVREQLRLGPKEIVLAVRKVFLADRRPVRESFSRQDLVDHVFRFLERFAGESAAYYVADLVPMVAVGAVAHRLECAEGTPLLLFDEVAYNVRDEAISCSLVHHRREGMLLRLVQSRP
jgi:GntR family transcriptional regulator